MMAGPGTVAATVDGMDLSERVEQKAVETGFAGIVRVDRGGTTDLSAAYGLADRRHGIPMTPDHQLATASGSKGMTALAVMSLVEDGTLTLGTTARSLLGEDLPLIADDVTIEHLLSHTSGIGDYLDESIDVPISAYALAVGVHELATTEQFLAILDGYPTAFPAGERFTYCNGGFIVLALLAERASGVSYHDLVRQRVCAPAGLADTALPAHGRPPGPGCRRLRRDGRRDPDQRVPPARARQRRRRHLHDGRGHAPLLDRAVRRCGRHPGDPSPR